MQKNIRFAVLLVFVFAAGTMFAITIQCDPQGVARWTGTTNGATITDSSEVRGWHNEDGWFMFDISGIPDDAAINSVEFHGYVNATNHPWWSMTPITCDPLTADAATLFADIIAEEDIGYYLYRNEAYDYTTGWKVYNLGAQAVIDLQANLGNDWFACGMTSRDNAVSYPINWDGWNQTNVPYVIVDYTPVGALSPATNPNPLNGANAVSRDGTLTWDWGTINDTYDLWFGPVGAATEVVTGSACTDTSGSYAYAGLTAFADYEWWVISYDIDMNSASSPHWDFTPCDSTQGGPDTFGYTWYNSNDAAGPTYTWIDPVIRTEMLPLPGDDTFVGPFALGFDFCFYGNTYNEFYFCSNGYLMFGGGSSSLSNQNLPNASTPNNIIAWFWNDLDPANDPDNDTHIYYETRLVGGDNACVVTMENYHEYPGQNSGKLTCQVILFENGDIKLQYQSFDGGIVMTSASVGIENIDGTDGLCYEYNMNLLSAETAILFHTPASAFPDVLITMSGDDAVLAWDAVTGAVQYHVYYATDPSGPWAEFGDSPIPGLTYTHTGIGATDVKYFYYVTADDTAPARR
ncbi:MAG: hypothetical protein K8R90_01235 [Candidatus Cloacimonetes bacterium]|nr:hypothetical protein [Candidatus Cloacimonadota bacterium]